MSFYLFNILLLCICGQLVLSQDFYRAAITTPNGKQNHNTKNYASLIHEAAEMKADILVLETQDDKNNLESCDRCLNYDEIVKAVAKAAKEAAIYVAAHMYEKITCDTNEDIVRSNLVFNRKGDIISVSRKPLKNPNCNSTYTSSASFSTDFGVTFEVLMEEDMLNVQHVNHDNIVLGSWPHKSGESNVSQLESSWAFINKCNLISVNGIYGNTGATIKSYNIIVKEISNNGNDQPNFTSSPFVFTNLAQSIKLDLEMATQGFKEIICFEEFCCRFYIKTEGKGTSNVSYSLGVHTGSMNLGPQTLATRGCALIAYAGSDQSCSVLSRNSDITFKTISISGNFSEGSIQLPISQTDMNENIKFYRQNGFERQVNMEIRECDNVLHFGIISIDQLIDDHSENLLDFSSYISSENVREFFDYLWIRLRVPIFIVSIYILEMM